MDEKRIASTRRVLVRMDAALRLEEVAERLRARGAHGLVTRADEVMRGVFTFNKTWDMERCLDPYEFSGEDWNVVHNDDEEWCFMLNRMDYLVDLVVATLVTKERAYAARALELIRSWVATHPSIEPELSTRTLDTGIRIGVWAQVMPALNYLGMLDDADLACMRASIDAQMTYLQAHYLAKYETSNWGSIQTLSILFALCVLEEVPTVHPLWEWACGRVESQMRAQVYPDGIDWEQSTMYHVEVLMNALRARHALAARGMAAPAHLEAAAKALTRALCAQMMPTGEIDAQGDSDRCNVRGLLALCAGVCGDAQAKAACGRCRLDDQDLFEYGCEVEDALAALSGDELPPTCFDGVDGGLYLTRTAWDAAASWTCFSHGPLGSGHGHSDNLHVSCAYRGVPVLVDSGRYTYREDDPMRPALKGPAAHNTPLLDGASSCQPKGSWGYADFARPLKAFARHADGVHYYEGALIGHDPLHVLMRRLVVLDDGVWIGCDEAYADGVHELEARFHIDPALTVTETAGVRAEGAEASYEAVLRGPGVEGTGLQGSSAGDNGIERGGVELTFGSTVLGSLERTACSLGYNELCDRALVRLQAPVHDRGGILWWLAPRAARVTRVPVLRNLDTPVDSDLAEAVRIEVNPGEFHTVILFHDEVYSGVKAFSCEGVSFHAKVAVIHGKGDDRTLTVLRA